MRVHALLSVALMTIAFQAPSSYGEQLTVLALNGKTGKPIANEHLVVWAGADTDSLRSKILHFDLRTDKSGIAVLDLPAPAISLVQVWVDFHTQCSIHPNSNEYSVAQIRKSGVIGENNCGTKAGVARPNTLYIYARNAHWWEEMRW